MDIKISVVVPAYNAENFIDRCINSILSQKFPSYQIIVVDDGSTDNTANIVKSYGKDVDYIYQRNGGEPSARNTGIRNATGDWIAFLDSDDEWLDTHLENFVNIIKENSNLAWYGSPVRHVDNRSGRILLDYKECRSKNYINRSYFRDYLSALPPSGFFSSATMIINKAVFEKVGLFNLCLKTGTDVDMWFRIGLNYPEIGYSGKTSAIVYKRSDSLSHAKPWFPDKTLETLGDSEKTAKKMGDSFALRAEPRIIYRVIKLLRASLRVQDDNTLNEIKKRYYSKLPIKYKVILLLTSTIPISLRIINRVKS
jgi:glycosyltransferase involved in cell wall biosynthesis